jgi:hypothetical protein
MTLHVTRGREPKGRVDSELFAHVIAIRSTIAKFKIYWSLFYTGNIIQMSLDHNDVREMQKAMSRDPNDECREWRVLNNRRYET